MNRHYDYVVVGSGLAGLYSSYYLSEHGTVALIAQGKIEESNSYHAQGGIAATVDPADSAQAHYTDTMVAGADLNDPDAVRLLTEDAPERIRELIDLGMVFDRNEDGNLALGLEGGHHHHRILHAGGDDTGHHISAFMIRQVRRTPAITLFENHEAMELILQDGRCCGIQVYDKEQHGVDAFWSSGVVLATGGCGALFSPTTNPPSALGDGIAIAAEAGARLRDLEFMQFHPTALYTGDDQAFLISEAVRGEGAILLNEADEPFMQGRHPLADLAPRDIVAREIFREMQRSGAPHVWLSLRHLDPDHIRKRFPTISQHLDRLGIDITDRIPVAPAAHYTVGGIETDLDGRTSIPGLYSVGEAASTGVMGANRLASNSLIECLVFSKRIAEIAPGERTVAANAEADVPLPWDKEHCLQWYASEGKAIERRTARLMTSHCGIIRTASELTSAIGLVQEEEKKVAPIAQQNVYARMTLRRLRLSRRILESALARKESRGGHWRSDYPVTLPPAEAYHTILRCGQISHEHLKAPLESEPFLS